MPIQPNRRQLLQSSAFTVVPRHVLGGAGFVAPSDKITLACIGCGTQALNEISGLLMSPDIRIVSVCDPNRFASGYRDWSPDGLLNSIRRLLKKPSWFAGADATIPGGREATKNIVDTFYGSEPAAGCTAYADFRELLAKEKDVMAVKIMTPDHLHGVACLAAMKRGKHIMLHKPIANRLMEGKAVIDAARRTGVATHFLPWNSGNGMPQVMEWISQGAIGTLREIHNWTNRPVWPQYTTLPAERPPVPRGFDWDLWLGPEAERPYHPDFTHMVFRGWYDFGAGTMADMGHYSLWSVFNALELSGPTVIEPMLSHHCALRDNAAYRIRNDFSFPTASIVRFKFPAKGQRGPVDLLWYDGGMKPQTPEEFDAEPKELPIEGMMFRGDKGFILAGFRVESPRLFAAGKAPTPVPPQARRQRAPGEASPGLQHWITAARGGVQSPGSFLNAWPITETVNLWAVALRTGRRLLYDAANLRITNVAEANQYLARRYRAGWEPEPV